MGNKTCGHSSNEECMICTICGECSETLDESDICADCKAKEAEENGHDPDQRLKKEMKQDDGIS